MMLFSSVDDFVERYTEAKLTLYGGPPSPDYVQILSVGSAAQRGRNYEHPGMWAFSALWFMQDVLRELHARTPDERNFIAWCLARLADLSWHAASKHPHCPYSRSFLYESGNNIVRRLDQELIDILAERGLISRPQ
ncbi:MAG: hypothetical protein ACF8MF_06610 [Phycisphaerales bacterium JB052]